MAYFYPPTYIFPLPGAISPDLFSDPLLTKDWLPVHPFLLLLDLISCLGNDHFLTTSVRRR